MAFLARLSDPSINSLDLAYNLIGDTGATAVANTIRKKTSLTSLGLSLNQITDAGVSAVADALKTNKILKTLDLSINQIGDAGATALSDALKTNTTLRELSLRNNQITDAGATALADSLKINTSLTKLDLVRNLMGEEGKQALQDTIDQRRKFKNKVLLRLQNPDGILYMPENPYLDKNRESRIDGLFNGQGFGRGIDIKRFLNDEENKALQATSKDAKTFTFIHDPYFTINYFKPKKSKSKSKQRKKFVK